MKAMPIIAAALLILALEAAFAFDNSQYDSADPQIRDWFRSVRSPCIYRPRIGDKVRCFLQRQMSVMAHRVISR